LKKGLDTKQILYSTNSWLSYRIAEMFYSGKHFVWCTPFFDGDDTPGNLFSIPPSSTPKSIAERLSQDIRQGDRHSSKIDGIKNGIIRGATLKKDAGIISADNVYEITQIVEQSRLEDFRPLVYVIPIAAVKIHLQVVDVSLRAHPLSEEYIISDLDRSLFDIISINS
jgi:hypothetical protein